MRYGWMVAKVSGDAEIYLQGTERICRHMVACVKNALPSIAGSIFGLDSINYYLQYA